MKEEQSIKALLEMIPKTDVHRITGLSKYKLDKILRDPQIECGPIVDKHKYIYMAYECINKMRELPGTGVLTAEDYYYIKVMRCFRIPLECIKRMYADLMPSLVRCIYTQDRFKYKQVDWKRLGFNELEGAAINSVVDKIWPHLIPTRYVRL